MKKPAKTVKPGNIYVAESDIGGRGVFAGKNFKKGEVIEECPVLLIQLGDMEQLKGTDIYNCCYEWRNVRSKFAIALGYGSLYNHSYDPNAEFNLKTRDKLIIITAIKAIRKDLEILTNYYGTGYTGKLWFPTK